MPARLSPAGAEPRPRERPGWLDDFHAGDPEVMRQCYVEHFAAVERAVGRILQGADKETVVHEVFYRIIADAGVRASFQGGSLRAWLSTVARNCAVDTKRRQQREMPAGAPPDLAEDAGEVASFESSAIARDWVARFRAERLPEKWRAVFEARFVAQASQSEAARSLGMRRTTLLYQELRIRQLLRTFFLRSEGV
jgi:RNA polymerase sigma-70 factor (ECF subfamily)